MTHRKTKHKVPSCNKYNSSGCDKLSEDCWYPHIMKQEEAQQNNKVNKAVSFATITATVQDFPKVTPNKTTPIIAQADIPTKAETIMMETMIVLKEQNKMIMELMLSMTQQNQQLIKMNPTVQQSQ